MRFLRRWDESGVNEGIVEVVCVCCLWCLMLLAGLLAFIFFVKRLVSGAIFEVLLALSSSCEKKCKKKCTMD